MTRVRIEHVAGQFDVEVWVVTFDNLAGHQILRHEKKYITLKDGGSVELHVHENQCVKVTEKR